MRDRNDIDEAESPDGIDVMHPHEAGTNQSHSNPGHATPTTATGCNRRCSLAHAGFAAGL